jgi:hypothetical protein
MVAARKLLHRSETRRTEGDIVVVEVEPFSRDAPNARAHAKFLVAAGANQAAPRLGAISDFTWFFHT